MKFSLALLALSVFSSAAIAAPVTDGQLQVVDQSPSPAGIAQAHLEKRRLKCQTVARAIWVSHGVLEAAAAFDLALRLTSKVSAGAGIVDAGTSYVNTNARSLPFEEFDIEALKIFNYTIASFEKVANPRIGARSDDGMPALVHQYRLQGVREKGSNVTRDYEIHHFEDGVAHLHIPLAETGSGSSLNKRHNGPGVKLAFQHAATRVDPNMLSGCAVAAASRWSEITSQGHANMFGLVEHNKKELMFYRSILEGKGFGNNYEDVMACGNMRNYLGRSMPGP